MGSFREREIMRNFKSVLVTGMAVAALVGLSGCSTSGHKNDGRTAGRVVDDNRLTRQVKDKLGAEPVYKFNSVDVRTFDGVVQLSGFVQTEDQKARAQQIAQSVPGVANVINSIAITPQPGPTPTGRNEGYNTNAPASTAPLNR